MFKLHEPKKESQRVLTMIDKGLVAVAQNDYEDAYKQFEKAHEIDKDNILVIIKAFSGSVIVVNSSFL